MFEVLAQFSFWSLIDIGLLSIFIYQILNLLSGTRAGQMLIGVLFVFGIYFFSSVFPLTTLHWMMSKFYSSFIIIMIILFQDDIRHVLRRIGKKPFIPASENISSGFAIDEIVRATQSLANKRVGALIVLERNIVLNRYVEIGVALDSKITKELLVSIFQVSTPLHDGAVIIQRGRIAAAGCFLPLTQKDNLDTNLGTRHRAAIGISQETDAVVLVVSEEVGVVSLVIDGVITRKLDANNLRTELRTLLLAGEEYEFASNYDGEFSLNKVISKKIKNLFQSSRK